MSMLSAQMDELRELATRYDELQVGAVKAARMPSNMGSILRDAADTIWELRESVHRERAEADKLRELVNGLEYCVQGHVCDCCPLYDPSGTNHRRCESLERELGVEVDG